MKKLLGFAIFSVLLSVAIQAQAIPTLFFDGNLSYDKDFGILYINAHLDGSDGLPDNPASFGSLMTVSALYSASYTEDYYTTGIFLTALLDPDISIINDNGEGDILLKGDVSQLVLEGLNNTGLGYLTGQITLTGGSLLGDFSSPSNVISLTLNLTTRINDSDIPYMFNPDMFKANFSGQIDGKIYSTPVPEPATLILFSLCIPAIVGMRKKNTVK